MSRRWSRNGSILGRSPAKNTTSRRSSPLKIGGTPCRINDLRVFRRTLVSAVVSSGGTPPTVFVAQSNRRRVPRSGSWSTNSPSACLEPPPLAAVVVPSSVSMTYPVYSSERLRAMMPRSYASRPITAPCLKHLRGTAVETPRGPVVESLVESIPSTRSSLPASGIAFRRRARRTIGEMHSSGFGVADRPSLLAAPGADRADNRRVARLVAPQRGPDAGAYAPRKSDAGAALWRYPRCSSPRSATTSRRPGRCTCGRACGRGAQVSGFVRRRWPGLLE